MWIVLPVKAFDLAKQRLADALNKAQRAQLAQAMFADVVAALQQCADVERIVVVSADQQVLEKAQQLQLIALAESPQCQGLNAAITEALDYVYQQGQQQALVLHADIPLVTAADISQLCQRYKAGQVSLVSDAAADGSNALILPLPLTFPLAYGINSAAAHKAACLKAGIVCEELSLVNLQLDIDNNDDLAVFKALHPQQPLNSYAFLSHLHNQTMPNTMTLSNRYH